jgi:DNA mismatch endonuclease (patch repair protein)
MTDKYNKQKRSQIMASILGKKTKPEIIVADLLVRLKYRFRQNDKTLPGTPDFVLPDCKKIIFVNGCFWHGHKECIRSKLPATNKTFWKNKIIDNTKRDKRIRRKLNKMGWKTLTIWQCQMGKSRQLKLEIRIERFMVPEAT